MSGHPSSKKEWLPMHFTPIQLKEDDWMFYIAIQKTGSQVLRDLIRNVSLLSMVIYVASKVAIAFI